MALDWWRSWNGAPTDTKWLAISKRAGVLPGIVSAVAWALFDYASQEEDRGSVKGFEIEGYAAFSGFQEEQINSIIKAFKDKGLIENDRLKSWEKRQPKREDETATSRKKKQRERDKEQKKNVTNGHAVSHDVTTDKSRVDKDKIKNFASAEGKNLNGFHFQFSGEPFDGKVLQLDGVSFNKLFQEYSNNGNEGQFRRLLQKRDDWYIGKPFKLYANGKWLTDTCKWLLKNKRYPDSDMGLSN